MERETLSIPISDKLGSISAIYETPSNTNAVLLMAHGAGAGIHHSFLEQLSQRILAKNLGVLRYQFPYMEKGGRPNKPEKDHTTILQVIEYIQTRSNLPIFLAGKSYGGRMSSQTVSLNPTLDVKGLIYFGFPLHAPGRDGKQRAEHLYTIEKPMLFLQGTRDALANIDLIKEVVEDCKNASLKILETADHSFKSPKKSGRTLDDNLDWLADQASLFITSHV